MPSKDTARLGTDHTEAPWNLKDIRALIDLLVEREISEFEMEKNGWRIRVRRGQKKTEPSSIQLFSPLPTTTAAPVSSAAPAGSAAAMTAPPAQAEPPATSELQDAVPTNGVHIINSPIVGTFYAAPGPDAPPFVKVGDLVQEGQVLCIIEAMKLMNEIEAELAGTVMQALVENGQPVEYGQPLFAIKPLQKR
jgi:acetyl-CoA carboxylase biotin carboxyl carrier protein